MRLGDLTIAAAVAAGLLVSVSTTGATAQEYCVECTQPNAIYRCVLENAKPGVVPSLQTHCITVLAKEGQHGTCSIKRATVFECTGPIKRVPVVAEGTPPTAAGGVSQGAAAPPAPAQNEAKTAPPVMQPAPSAQPGNPPQTVKEAAERAAQKTGAQLKKAGESVKQTTEKAAETTGNAFTKTWACVSSFFTKCF